MRAFKILGFVIGGIIALVVILLLAVWLFVNPNDYKDRIAKAVKTSTGRELALPGDIKLSVFPWVALELGPASLGNLEGFGAEPFAAVQHAALRVKLLPLLHKELQIGRIEIEGLDLRLKKNAAGKGNWEDFGQKPATPDAPASSEPVQLPDLAGVIIKQSRIAYQNLVADKIDLDMGHVAPKTPIPVKLSMEVVTAPGAQPMQIASKFDVTLDMAAKQYRFAPLELSGTWVPKPGAAEVPWKFSSPDFSADLAAQTMAAPSFAAQLGAAHLTGQVSGSKIVDALNVRGEFNLESVVLRELMGRLGMTPPVTRDAKVLSKFAARGAFAYGGNAARAEKLDVQLDDSELKGNAAITNLDTKAMTFDLSLDRIDLDRYLPPPTAAPKPDAKPFELPTDTLKGLQANGTVAIGSAKIAGVTLSNVRVGVDSKGGVTRVAPAKAQLYGGQYSGDITVDTRAAVPAMKIDQTMTGIDVAQLLNDFAKTKRLTGKGNVTTNLTAQGRGGDALIKSLNGRVTANLADGAVEGLDLWYAISQAQSLIQKQGLAGGTNSGRTKFDSFKTSADIAGGVATTKDLNIASQQLRVTGQGTSNLVTEAIDYKVNATILKAPPTANASNLSSLTLAEIPVTITGTMASPKVRPDLEGLAKARVKQELDKHKDEIKQKIGDKLKGLFH